VAATAPIAMMSGSAAPVLSTIAFAPDGLQFAVPVRMRQPMPTKPSGALYSVSELTMVSTVQDDGSGDSNPLESVPLGQGDADTLEALLAHFSTVTVFGPILAGATLSQVCATSLARGLSAQILTELTAMTGVGFVPIASTAVDCSRCEQPFLQKQAASHLQAAVSGAKPAAIHINSAWRSVADQYILAKVPCANPNRNTVARVGQSPHMSGNAIDVQNPNLGMTMKDACSKYFTDAAGASKPVPTAQEALNFLHPIWAGPLTANSFAWLARDGTDEQSTCRDPPHFTDLSVSIDYRAKNIQAFQSLWNKHRSCNPIPQSELDAVANSPPDSEVLESAIPQTLDRLGRAPVVGFDPADAASPAPTGTPGLGCAFTATPSAIPGTVLANQPVPFTVTVTATGAIPGLACVPSSANVTADPTKTTCLATVPANAPCAFGFTFKAATAGDKTETIVCSGGTTVRNVSVTTTVVTPPILTIAPNPASFSADVGATSQVTIFSVGNAGGTTSGVLTKVIGGANATEFVITNDGCVLPLAALATCTVQVVFKPTTPGTKAATITVSDPTGGSTPASETMSGVATPGP
jgi:hypothetical protein